MTITHLKLNNFEIQRLESTDYKRADEQFRVYRYEGGQMNLIARIYSGCESIWVETEGMKLYDLPIEEINDFNYLIKMFYECDQQP